MPSPFGHFRRTPLGHFVRSTFGHFDGRRTRECQDVTPPPGAQTGACCVFDVCVQDVTQAVCGQIGGFWRGGPCQHPIWPTQGTCHFALVPQGGCCVSSRRRSYSIVPGECVAGPWVDLGVYCNITRPEFCTSSQNFDDLHGNCPSIMVFESSATYRGDFTVCPWENASGSSCVFYPPASPYTQCPPCTAVPGTCKTTLPNGQVLNHGFRTEFSCTVQHPGATWTAVAPPFFCHMQSPNICYYPPNWYTYGACCSQDDGCTQTSALECNPMFRQNADGTFSEISQHNDGTSYGSFAQGQWCPPLGSPSCGGACCLGCRYCVEGIYRNACESLGGSFNPFGVCNGINDDICDR